MMGDEVAQPLGAHRAWTTHMTMPFQVLPAVEGAERD